MNCRDCLKKLDSFTDRELSDAELEAVRRHLGHCPPCDGHYQLQAGLKRLVKVCCDQGEAPPALREKLREILY